MFSGTFWSKALSKWAATNPRNTCANSLQRARRLPTLTHAKSSPLSRGRPPPAPEFGEQIGKRGYQSCDGGNNGGKRGVVHVGRASVSELELEVKPKYLRRFIIQKVGTLINLKSQIQSRCYWQNLMWRKDVVTSQLLEILAAQRFAAPPPSKLCTG
jgi:hypothetical protein